MAASSLHFLLLVLTPTLLLSITINPSYLLDSFTGWTLNSGTQPSQGTSAVCPNGKTYCWQSTANFEAQLTNPVITTSYNNVQFSYSVTVSGTVKGPDECGIQYTVDGTTWSDVVRFSANSGHTYPHSETVSFSSWTPAGAADANANGVYIKVLMAGNGGFECLFNDFIFDGTALTPSPTLSVPPSKSPTISPSTTPSVTPTSSSPTNVPTTPPTASPLTNAPTNIPSASPSTQTPSTSPTATTMTTPNPTTIAPTTTPTTSPTNSPTSAAPTGSPLTASPTTAGQTRSPSSSPSASPSTAPTHSPTVSITTLIPSSSPTITTSDPTSNTATPTSSPITVATNTSSSTTKAPSSSPVSSTTTGNPSQSPIITVSSTEQDTDSDTDTDTDGQAASTSNGTGEELDALYIVIGILLCVLLVVLVWCVLYYRKTRKTRKELSRKLDEVQAPEMENLKLRNVPTVSADANCKGLKAHRIAEPAPRSPITPLSPAAGSQRSPTTSSDNHLSEGNAYSEDTTTLYTAVRTDDVELAAVNKPKMKQKVVSSSYHQQHGTKVAPIAIRKKPAHDDEESMDTPMTADGSQETVLLNYAVDDDAKTKDKALGAPQKQRRYSLESGAPNWLTTPSNVDAELSNLSMNTISTRNRAVTAAETWEKQMNELKEQMMKLQAQRPASVRIVPHQHPNFAFFKQQAMSNPMDHVDYSNLPMSAPANDTQFFNTMLHNLAHSANPTSAFNRYMNGNTATGVNTAIPVQTAVVPQIPIISVNGVDFHDIPPPPPASDREKHTRAISEDVSLLSVEHEDAFPANRTVTTRTELSKLSEYTKTSHDEDSEHSGSSSDSATNTVSRNDTLTGDIRKSGKRKHKRTFSGDSGRETHSRSSSDDEEEEEEESASHTESTTVTMSMSLTAEAQQPTHVKNKISRHFRVPSVLTDKGNDDEHENSMDLPSLLEDDKKTHLQVISDQIEALPDYDEEEEEKHHDEDDGDEEYSDSMQQHDEESNTKATLTLLTVHNSRDDEEDLAEMTEPDDEDDDGSQRGSGSASSTVSTVDASYTDDKPIDDEHVEFNGSVQINDDQLMDDDFDDMLGGQLTAMEIQKSFNDNEEESEATEDESDATFED